MMNMCACDGCKCNSEKPSENLVIPPEFFDFLKILRSGAEKHGPNNWLELNGRKSSHKEMHDSMFHHLSNSYAKIRIDGESGLDHLLHLQVRAAMMYTRIVRGITHSED
jgi:hypothetical protein